MAGGLIRVGCCGWPVARDRYVAAFDVVEVQESFYNLPRRSTVERWRAGVPETFEFVLKASQLVTHEASSPTYRRLRTPLPAARARRCGSFRATGEVRAAWTETVTLASLLRSRIVLVQCPASFTPTVVNVRRLTAFFEEAERDGLGIAWEPRGDWPDAEVERLCRRLDLIHCVDPFQRRPVWGRPAYLRLHGRGGYRYAYSDADLRELQAIVGDLGEAYVFFNNLSMFDDARRFRRLLEGG